MIISKELADVWRKHFKGNSYKQISKEAGISTGTITRVLKQRVCDPATHDKINNWILAKKENHKKLIKKLQAA